MANLTTLACLPASEPDADLSGYQVNAWIEPSLIVCNRPQEVLLHVLPLPDQAPRVFLSLEGWRAQLRSPSPGSLASTVTYEVPLELPCRERAVNLTTRWLTLRADQGTSLVRVPVLLVRHLTILAVTRSTGWAGAGSRLSLAVDRPLDLAILAEAVGKDLLCVFGETALLPAGWEGDRLSCPVPEWPKSEGLELGLRGPGGSMVLLTHSTFPLDLEAIFPASSVEAGNEVDDPVLKTSLAPLSALFFGTEPTQAIALDVFGAKSVAGLQCIVRA